MKAVITLDTVDRIFELADAKFKEQKDFAQAIGYFPSKVSEWKARKSKSYQKRLPQIAEVLGTSVDYLLTGEKKEPTTVSGDGQAAKLAQALRDIGIDVDQLSEADVRKIAKLAKTLFEE